tara:strand:+ start:193 stop:720 length:528 start_codon:yes stop_codon:yes gene_type:complete
MPSLENLSIEAPDLDRIRRESGAATEDGVRLLWMALNDTRKLVRAADQRQVLQVVQAGTVTSVSTTSATYVTTGLTATITPKRSDSTLTVDIHQHIGSGNTTNWDYRLVRDSTEVVQAISNRDYKSFISLTTTDTPGSGVFVYRTEMRRVSGANSITAQQGSALRSTITITEVSP